jgi:hyperosmotically inducible periplasmic protein
MRLKDMVLLVSAVCLFTIAYPQSKQGWNPINSRLWYAVRHELMMIRDYSVFDSLEFELSGADTVILIGQVTRPSLKSAAEDAIRRLEGVGRLVNKIEVLPISPADEKIRIVAYEAIFSKRRLGRYVYCAVSPIHIIVKNGSITLIGVVANEADKEVAGMAVKDIPATFGVTNTLKIEIR